MGKAQNRKSAQHLIRKDRGSTYAPSVKAQRKPISRTARKGSVQTGDELVATLGDQAL
jgi:hypothetical protein